MSRLTTDTLNKCFSLLRDYIEGSPLNGRKEIACLALKQLQTITAGSDTSKNDGNDKVDVESIYNCSGKPRAGAD